MKRYLGALTALALAALVLGSSAIAGTLRIESAASAPPARGTLSAAAELALKQGYLVPDQAAYERAKARAASAFAARATVPPAGPAAAPVTFRSWNGLSDGRGSPSDSTGAIGITRYIELVNSRFGIYDRTSNTPIGSGDLSALDGFGSNVFDPQIMWDGQTNRFYYVNDVVLSATDNRLAFGFSKTASPSSALDFCQYDISFGSLFPDYPKVGDTKSFILIGTNNFPAGAATSTSGLIAVTKPGSAAITTCPSPTTFSLSQAPAEVMANTSTPVPANQVDPSTTGWVVAEAEATALGLGPSTTLPLVKVTTNPDGSAAFTRAPDVPVSSYDIPPGAPMPGVTQVLDTLDGRPTQAVLARDPSLGTNGMTMLWTQHAVAGGAGAQVRWYEINPAASAVKRQGKATSPSLFAFNAAISPDRRFQPAAGGLFGNSMVMTYSTSSTTQNPAIQAVSKTGANAQSAPLLIKQSPGPGIDFTCPNAHDTCRWGDYSGASPDPASSTTGAHGAVWITNQWNRNGNLTPLGVNWRSWNAALTP